jgi:predicted unusual protein kinase regulating ubiquinone biosynthesis (AarF/ABC1/UbiB family)
MVGRLTKHMKRSLKEIFLGFVTRNSHSIVNALVSLGFIGEGANQAAIERGLSILLEQYYGITLGEVRELDFPEVARELENLLYGQPFHIPAQFAFSGRAVGTLVGVSTGLAPDFNFLEVATPYARSFLGLDAEGITQTVQDVFTQLLDTSKVMLELPRSIERVIARIETGQLEVRLANIPGGHSRRSRGRRGNGGSTITASSNGGGGALGGFMFVASLAGGIYLTGIHQAMPGWFCLGMAGITALATLIRR